MTNLIIETSNLSKIFDSKPVVSNVNIRVEQGSIYGFLGANGAGKTTTIKMLLGLLKPTSGEIAILNKNLSTNKIAILSRVGAMIETPCAYGHLTGRENLRFVATLLNINNNRIDECLNIVNLTDNACKKVRDYSLGMKQRLGIALSLLNDPQLLILDEPTNGLDPIGIREMREFIKELPNRLGISLFISSHMLSEINLIATHIGIIHKGNLIFQDTLDKLKNENYPKYLIRVDDTIATKKVLAGYKISGVADNKDNYKKIVIEVADEQEISKINKVLVDEGINVYELIPIQATLEDIFLKYIDKN
jgi:lantibiotic transport system ATP-binding protein